MSFHEEKHDYSSNTEESAPALHQTLLSGCEFLKYGKRGDPHYKFVHCSASGLLMWGDSVDDKSTKKIKYVTPPHSFPLFFLSFFLSLSLPFCLLCCHLSSCGLSPPTLQLSHILTLVIYTNSAHSLSEVTTVVKGKHSKVFKRSKAESAPVHLCFTIVTPHRTLDLQSPSMAVRDLWVEAITSAVLYTKKGFRIGSDWDAAARTPGMIERDRGESGALPRNDGMIEAKLTPAENKCIEFVDYGAQLVKHGRKGNPKPKWVQVRSGKLFWGSPKGHGDGLKEVSNFIILTEIKGILSGKKTKVFKRSASRGAQEHCCFSLVTAARTLDLETATEREREKWVQALSFTVRKAKQMADKKWLMKQSNLSNTFRRTYSFTEGALHGGGAGGPGASNGDGSLSLTSSGLPDTSPAGRSLTWSRVQGPPRSKSLSFNNFDAGSNSSSPSHTHEFTRSGTARRSNGRPLYHSPSSNLDDDDSFTDGDNEDNSDLSFQEMKFLTFLDAGQELVKFGRQGSPKPKWVNICKGKIFWAPALHGRTPGSSSIRTFVLVVDVLGVLPGKMTKVFTRKCAKNVPSNTCFSVVTKERTLDFQCLTKKERDRWVQAFKFIVRRTKEEVDRQWKSKQRSASTSFQTVNAKQLRDMQNRVGSSSSLSLNSTHSNSSSVIGGSLDRSISTDSDMTMQTGKLVRSNTWSSRDHSKLLATKMVLDMIAGNAEIGDISGKDGKKPSRTGTWRRQKSVGRSDDLMHSSLRALKATDINDDDHHNSSRDGDSLDLAIPAYMLQKSNSRTSVADVFNLTIPESALERAIEEEDIQPLTPKRDEAPPLPPRPFSPDPDSSPDRKRRSKKRSGRTSLETLARDENKHSENNIVVGGSTNQNEPLEEGGSTMDRKTGEEMARRLRESAEEMQRLADEEEAERRRREEEEDREALELAEAEAEAEAEALALSQAAKRRMEEEERIRRRKQRERFEAKYDSEEEERNERETTTGGTLEEDREGEGEEGSRKKYTGDYDDEDEDDGAFSVAEEEFVEDLSSIEEEPSVADTDYSEIEEEVSESSEDDNTDIDDRETRIRLSKRQVTNHLALLKEGRHVLKDVSQNWNERSRLMTLLEEAIRSKNLTAIPMWWKEAEKLKRCIKAQLEDLRSSIVVQACKLVICMAQAVGKKEKFADLFIYLLPTLLKKLFVTIKVMSSSCDDCIKAVLKHAHNFAPLVIPELLYHATKDAHAIVRQRCAEYTAQILIQSSDNVSVDEYIVEIAKVVKNNITDPDRNARSGTRMLFLAFEYLWPQAGKKMGAKFSKPITKTIDMERKPFKIRRRQITASLVELEEAAV